MMYAWWGFLLFFGCMLILCAVAILLERRTKDTHILDIRPWRVVINIILTQGAFEIMYPFIVFSLDLIWLQTFWASQVWSSREHNFVTQRGLITFFASIAAFGSLFLPLTVIVRNSKNMPDCVFTVFFIHFIIVSIVQGGFPSEGAWWVSCAGGFLLGVLTSEFVCNKFELISYESSLGGKAKVEESEEGKAKVPGMYKAPSYGSLDLPPPPAAVISAELGDVSMVELNRSRALHIERHIEMDRDLRHSSSGQQRRSQSSRTPKLRTSRGVYEEDPYQTEIVPQAANQAVLQLKGSRESYSRTSSDGRLSSSRRLRESTEPLNHRRKSRDAISPPLGSSADLERSRGRESTQISPRGQISPRDQVRRVEGGMGTSHRSTSDDRHDERRKSRRHVRRTSSRTLGESKESSRRSGATLAATSPSTPTRASRSQRQSQYAGRRGVTESSLRRKSSGRELNRRSTQRMDKESSSSSPPLSRYSRQLDDSMDMDKGKRKDDNGRDDNDNSNDDDDHDDDDSDDIDKRNTPEKEPRHD